MKKLSILFFALLFSADLFSADTLSQELSSSKDLGLISYLTTVKSFTEYKMITLVSDPLYKNETGKIKSFQSDYNHIRLAVDRLLNQTVADMTAKNKLTVYKKINKFVKGDIDNLPTSMEAYKKVFEDINGKLETFLQKSYSSDKGPSIDDVLGILELTHTIITDARDFREKKVANISSQLKELKIKPLKELMEEKKEK